LSLKDKNKINKIQVLKRDSKNKHKNKNKKKTWIIENKKRKKSKKNRTTCCQFSVTVVKLVVEQSIIQ